MKKTSPANNEELPRQFLPTEYRFDYRKARPNRFADKPKEGRVVVILDPDVAQVFTSPQTVNEVLRALIKAMPPTSQYHVGEK